MISWISEKDKVDLTGYSKTETGIIKLSQYFIFTFIDLFSFKKRYDRNLKVQISGFEDGDI